ncbi:DUF2851 family protein [Olivibacter sp. CPCC 100613]|uniref:DUF2851 family protein n=1 Tax=Olivibacter sp. CPCC 100613 TaxID=3079931 RepID=UPI002FF59222
MEFPEKVLHYIWRYRLYKHVNLITKKGKSLVVLSPGILNNNAGPDFEYCRLRIGETEWAGAVELHLKSSDWYTHQHQRDEAYNNVILHVVYEHDGEIQLSDGTVPETLELKPLISGNLLTKYNVLMQSKAWVPCQPYLPDIDYFVIEQWLARLLTERLQEKSNDLSRLLTDKKADWEEVTYILLARNFGFKVNAIPFELLAKNTPYKLISKNRSQPKLIEALLFGQAGLLERESFNDAYPNRLKQDYLHLQDRYQLVPIPASTWKFLRMRPANFPTIRLAQFVAWCAGGEHLFSKILQCKSVEQLRQLFVELPVHNYWTEHYVFDKTTKKHNSTLGISSIDNIIVNTVVTILVGYGKYVGKEMYLYRAIDLLEQLRGEQNRIISQFKHLGLEVKSAAASQALLQLKHAYCDQHKCLDCGIGLQVFKQNKTL